MLMNSSKILMVARCAGMQTSRRDPFTVVDTMLHLPLPSFHAHTTQNLELQACSWLAYKLSGTVYKQPLPAGNRTVPARAPSCSMLTLSLITWYTQESGWPCKMGNSLPPLRHPCLEHSQQGKELPAPAECGTPARALSNAEAKPKEKKQAQNEYVAST